uniref:Uncharacterized protein n=1 Tax=Arundo donax TaxID=35708 RepID=A0A0A8Z0C3_ARUDO
MHDASHPAVTHMRTGQQTAKVVLLARHARATT